MNPNAQQAAIFSFVANSKGNLVVRARAGTGKTTTILEAVKFAPESSILLCAFNKSIADELSKRLTNPKAVAKTLHSVGFSSILRNWKGTQVDAGRGRKIAERLVGGSASDSIINMVTKLASYGKNMLPTNVFEMMDIAVKFDTMPDSDEEARGWDLNKVCTLALRAMDQAKLRDGTVDFDDMVFVAVANRFATAQYGLVIVDEAQDMNKAQLALARMVVQKNGRTIVVGDDRQAIYGFRGADEGSIDRLKTELKATELGLTITYRCPKSVVELAKVIVPDFQAADSAPAGEIKNIDAGKLIDAAMPGDFILSRKNAPLAKICLGLLRNNKKAKVEGKDIGAKLARIVRKLQVKSMDELRGKLDQWLNSALTSISGATEEVRASKAGELVDSVETISALADGVVSVAELLTRIDTMFADCTEGNTIVCSSVHKAKGRERDNVFLLTDTFRESTTEERNIKYVAITRTRRTLTWVAGDAKEE